jgi:hypothetical protein
MEIHKPKTWHSLRELAKEVAVIVIGVAIALTGEQIVEALHWAHRTHVAEQAMRQELASDLGFAQEQQALSPCADRYIDALQSAVQANRPDLIEKVRVLSNSPSGGPVDNHTWTLDTWKAVLAGQVTDHLPAREVQVYARLFDLVSAERDAQSATASLAAEVATGRFGRLDNPVVAADQLKTLDRLRLNELQRRQISSLMLRVAKAELGITPSTARAPEFDRWIAGCEANAAKLPQP